MFVSPFPKWPRRLILDLLTWGLAFVLLSPVVGVSYTLNGDDVTIAGDTFEAKPLGAWGTVGIGWSFQRSP